MKIFFDMVQIGTLALLLAFTGMPALAASHTPGDHGCTPAVTDKECIDRVLDKFQPLTKIPRASHHEEAIGSYLFNWAKEKGFAPVRDRVGNVVFDIPATPGMEQRPRIGLQVHMDMVAVGLNGFDPLHDHPIALVEGRRLCARSSSLGADDGIGIALLLNIADGCMAHGPLRAIITVDEEDTMTGVNNLDAKVVQDLPALINIDGEVADEVTVSTASAVKVFFSLKSAGVPARLTKAYTVQLTGLRGGHSGLDIHKGRVNAVLALSDMLRNLSGFELASLEGGRFGNAIPSAAAAKVVVADPSALRNLCATFSLADEPGLRFTVTEAPVPAQVFSEDSTRMIFSFLRTLPNGVQTMSKDMEGLVECSCNLGIFRATPEGCSALSFVRSSDVSAEERLLEKQRLCAGQLGASVKTEHVAEAWAFRPGSRLLKIAKAVFHEQNGRDIRACGIHAGLECGVFAKHNPALEMIAIGPTLHDVHSVREVCDIETIPMTWRLLEGILERYQ